MKHCPNAGHCSCPEHALGLMEYTPDVQAFLEWLKQADREKAAARLAAVPVPENPAPVYHGDRPQPWEPRPARNLRRAA